MKLNDLLMTFLRENMRKGRGFGEPNRGQGKILTILKQTPYLSQKELVEQLDIKPQSASEIIKKLEKKGFIERHKSPEDKRVMMISLTKSGKVVANQRDNVEPVILEALTLEEKEQFNHILTKLLDEVEPEVSSLKRRPERRPHR